MAEQTTDVLALYGRKHIFREKHQQGYTEFCFGQGKRDGETVVLWVFFHPEGEICTFEFHKAQSQEGVIHQMPFSENYEPEAFQNYVVEKHIRLSTKKNLAEFLDRWHTDEVPEIEGISRSD